LKYSPARRQYRDAGGALCRLRSTEPEHDPTIAKNTKNTATPANKPRHDKEDPDGILVTAVILIIHFLTNFRNLGLLSRGQ
jgi:hypothetical protein